MSYYVKLSELDNGIQGVYKINYPNGKIYIGISNDIKRRMYEHNNTMRLLSHPQQPCDLAIKKYGKINEIEILELVKDYNILLEREKYWIAYYHATDRNIGYNISPGGYSSGENSPNAVFTNEQVLDIRKRRFYGERKIDVYKDYNTHNFSTFQHIWLGRGYPGIGTEFLIPVNSKSRQEYSSLANSGSRNNKAKLNENMVKEIRRRYDSGENPMSIQKDFSFVNINSIRRVCKRETWKNVI